jgi:hypothetical protein
MLDRAGFIRDDTTRESTDWIAEGAMRRLLSPSMDPGLVWAGKLPVEEFFSWPLRPGECGGKLALDNVLMREVPGVYGTGAMPTIGDGDLILGIGEPGGLSAGLGELGSPGLGSGVRAYCCLIPGDNADESC